MPENVELQGALTWRIAWQNDPTKNLIEVLIIEIHDISYDYRIYFDHSASEPQEFSLTRLDNDLARCTYRKTQ